MPKRVLDVGNCAADHAAIRTMFEKSFGAEVVQAHGPHDTLELLQSQPFDLVLVNRKLDQDYSEGLSIIEKIKADNELAKTPCMLITNYPEYQQAAMAAGAMNGFGKRELYAEETRRKLERVLTPDA
jgi:CheY-like chemotaxis protein